MTTSKTTLMAYPTTHTTSASYWIEMASKSINWRDLPSTLEVYYRPHNACPCDNHSCKLLIDSTQHGSRTGYNNYSCRCDPCRSAARDYARNRMIVIMEDDDPRHGTLNGYNNLNCRCPMCGQAANAYYENIKSNNLPEGDYFHGTPAGYSTMGCRCSKCVAAHQIQRDEYSQRMMTFASLGGTCTNCGAILSNRMDMLCPKCTDLSADAEALRYEQINPRHPEARPFQKPHDYSGNE